LSERIGTKKSQGVAAAVNAQFHDEFVALSALYHSGEISEEEWALLQIHMAYCDSCHERFQQYQQIASDVIPAMAAVAASDLDKAPEESARSLDAAERRLMSRLDSLPAPQEIPSKRRFPRHTSAVLIAAGIAAIACVVGIYVIRGKSPAATNTPARAAYQAPQLAAPSSPGVGTQQPLQHSRNEVASLQKQLAASEQRSNQSNLALGDAQRQLEAEQAASKQIGEERATLSAQLASTQQEAESLRNQMASINAGSTQQTSRVADLEATVRDLKASLSEKDIALSEKDRMLDLDKDFLAHDRDIRDLIGARNLYIADITDTTEDGKTAKQFGRIFYTKDRSLVFYGFDLDSQTRHNKQNVSFKVWGSGSERPTPVNLGLFYQDDSHKRWVLRCNDAKTLARLDMVFVTVEPPGGSTKPTGKQLLRAYLQIPANHP
jgi:hypothetical protein